MISKNLQRGIITLNKGYPQNLLQILFKDKVLLSITPGTTMSAGNLSNSSNVTTQLLSPVTQMLLYSSALLNIPKHGLVEKDAERRKRTAAYDAGSGISCRSCTDSNNIVLL